MAAEWSFKIADDGWIELTVGPKPRRTIGFYPKEGRVLLETLSKAIQAGERFQEGSTEPEEKAI